MVSKSVPACQVLKQAHAALQRGGKQAARRRAQIAAAMAPELEDTWLILAAVARPPQPALPPWNGRWRSTLQPERARAIVIDERRAHSQVADLAECYPGWSKGQSLMNFGLTHPYQHVREISVLASLLGVVFE